MVKRFQCSLVMTGIVAVASYGQIACDPPEDDQGVVPRDLPPPAAPLVDGNSDPADWPSYGRDLWNTRHNPAEPDHTQVTQASVRWKVDLGGDVTATPVVVGSVVYAGAYNGQFASLDAGSGAPVWSVNLDAEPITASAAVSEGRVLVSTLAGNVWALDQATGGTLWTADLTGGNPNVALYTSPIQVDGIIYMGVASVEVYPTGDPISFQGSMAALDAETGDLLWQRYFASNTQYGAPVWSTPAVMDDMVYVGTGQAYSKPATQYSDSMIALNAGSGVIEWFKQWWANDVFVLLNPDGPDYDFGASPNLFWIGDRLVVGEGSKSGDYHVVDALDGTPVWSKRVSNGGFLGGFLGSTAYANGRIHAATNNLIGYMDPRLPLPPTGGKYVTLSASSGQVLHSRLTAPSLSSPCVAGGVVYYTDMLGTIWARNAATGNVLWSLPTLEPSGSGPSVSRGVLYVGTGVTSGLGVGVELPSLAHHLYAIDIDGP